MCCDVSHKVWEILWEYRSDNVKQASASGAWLQHRWLCHCKKIILFYHTKIWHNGGDFTLVTHNDSWQRKHQATEREYTCGHSFKEICLIKLLQNKSGSMVQIKTPTRLKV